MSIKYTIVQMNIPGNSSLKKTPAKNRYTGTTDDSSLFIGYRV